MNFSFVHFKRNWGIARPGDVFWMDRFHLDQVPHNVIGRIHTDTTISKFDPNKHKNLLIVRSGGIGDLLALSDIALSAIDQGIKLAVLTQRRMFPVIDWWKAQPTWLRHFDQPLFNVKRKSVPEFLQDWGTLRGEDVIERGSRDNWYQIFSDASGLASKGRPQLRNVRGTNTETEEMVLRIVAGSTSVNRTMAIEAVNDITKKWPGPVITNKESSLRDYLYDLYDAEMVISVDTAAIHFREGVCKPALGLYTAFTAESRTKFYRYTKSINIKSPCEFQPCFLHANTGKCYKAKPEDLVAPCLDPKFNPSLEEQITKAFTEML